MGPLREEALEMAATQAAAAAAAELTA